MTEITLAMLKKAHRILSAAEVPPQVLKIIAEYPLGKRETLPAFEVRKRKRKLVRRVLKNFKRANKSKRNKGD